MFFLIYEKKITVPLVFLVYFLNLNDQIGHINYSPLLQNTIGGTEAMYLMMKNAFVKLGNRRYEWKCNNLNTGSKNAAKRLGFKFEGIFVIDPKLPILFCFLFLFCFEDNLDIKLTNLSAAAILTPLFLYVNLSLFIIIKTMYDF